MRDSGYKSTATAIDEFIDNSIQAAATRIDIIYELDGGTIRNIAVIDDGHGMEPDMIRAAVVWGGTHRHNDRRGSAVSDLAYRVLLSASPSDMKSIQEQMGMDGTKSPLTCPKSVTADIEIKRV
jgi:hypothetical protein